jgi:hypothetical protein
MLRLLSIVAPGIVLAGTLAVGFARLSDAQEKGGLRPLSDEDVKAIVIKATAICRTTPLPDDMDPEAKSENGKYLDTIKPVLERGKKALPTLEKLATDADMPLLERRLAQIVAARIEHPERFEKIAPYFQPVQGMGIDAGRRISPPWGFRNLGPDVIHPDVREEYQRFEAEIAKVKSDYLQRYKQIKDRVDKEEPKALEELAEMMRKKNEELAKLSDQQMKKTKMRMDPAYELAWEEGLLRPVFRTMKNHFASYVRQIGDLGSAPVLAEFLRRVLLVDRPIPYSTFSPNPDSIREALDSLPADAELLALADVLRQTSNREQHSKLRDVFGPIGISREKEVIKLEADPKTKKDIEPLRQAVNDYRKERGQKVSP